MLEGADHLAEDLYRSNHPVVPRRATDRGSLEIRSNRAKKNIWALAQRQTTARGERTDHRRAETGKQVL